MSIDINNLGAYLNRINGGIMLADLDFADGANITFSPGSDKDMDLFEVIVTGTPKIYWDESEDAFHTNASFHVDDTLYVDTLIYVTSAVVTGNISPSADNTYDLGENSTPLEWKDLYIDGIAYIDGMSVPDAFTMVSETTQYSYIKHDAGAWDFFTKSSGAAALSRLRIPTDTDVVTVAMANANLLFGHNMAIMTNAATGTILNFQAYEGSGYVTLASMNSSATRANWVFARSITTGGQTPVNNYGNYFYLDFTSGGAGTTTYAHRFAGALTAATGDVDVVAGTAFTNTLTTQNAAETILIASQIYVNEPVITITGSSAVTTSSGIIINGVATEATYNTALYLRNVSNQKAIVASDSSVAHGMTTNAHTETFFDLSQAVSGYGGVLIRGFSENQYGVVIGGAASTADTTKTSAGLAPVILSGRLKSGTTYDVMSANGNLVAVMNYLTTVTLIDAEGDIWTAGNISLALDKNIYFGDTAVYIFSNDDGYLDLVADVGIRMAHSTTYLTSVDSALVADQVTLGAFDISAGHRALAISQEDPVVAEVDETLFSHAMPVRINGATYYIMLTSSLSV